VRMHYVTFNAWVGQTPERLTRNLLALVVFLRKPHGVFLQEVKRLRRAPRGYTLVQAREGDERRSSALLVRNDGTVRDHQFVQVPRGEWEWNGNARTPRTFVRATVQFGDHVEEWIAVHRIPKGPNPNIAKNRAGWAAEHTALVGWVRQTLARHPGRRVVIGGDWNSPPGHMPSHPASIQRLAKAIGARVWLRHIDGFLIVNGPAPDRVRVRKLLGKYGSDGHRPVSLRARA